MQRKPSNPNGRANAFDFAEAADMQAIGSLLLGYHDIHGQLIYAGRTGTGFTHKTHALIRTKLDTILSQTAYGSSPGCDLGPAKISGAGAFCHLDGR
jgi:ATP-dependent DNA ligase